MEALNAWRQAHQMSTFVAYIIRDLVFVGIVTMLLQSSSSKTVAATGPGGSSIKAELFHRDHPQIFSNMMQPSTKPQISHLEKLHSEGKRSAARARALVRRKITESTPRNLSSVTWETSITNEAPAEYLMMISLGTPPQNFVAVADTGSDLTWLQCAPCQHCFDQSSPVFDPSLSSTYRSLSCSSSGCQSFVQQYGNTSLTSCEETCDYAYYYGDNSNTTGTYSAETINLESTSGDIVKVPDFWFGCSQASFSPSALYDATNGLVGLGQGLISFPSQLGHVFDDIFSFCLVNRSLAAVQSSTLVFGRDAALDLLAFQYTPILSNPMVPFFYFIGLQGISVNGAAVNFNFSVLDMDCAGNGGTIIDSGTTFTYLDTRAFAPLLLDIDAKVPGIYERVTLSDDLSFLELCYNVTGRLGYASDLPVLSLQLANQTSWGLGFDNSWILLEGIPGDDQTLAVCLAILRGYEGEMSVLGNTQQQDFQVVYDRVHQRLGFAEADCAAAAAVDP